ncbi:LmeA family phospholipid-binding protein [Mycobacterium sp.]|uniref:LmeA family phospholipid-binding protein n=1 Tax=Mycobacterium sp. TaxID=1785 RepID=UPI003D0DB098
MTNPQGPPHQDPSSPWSRPGEQSSPTRPVPQAEYAYPPPTQEYPANATVEQPAPQDTAEPAKAKRRFRLRGDPVSIILVLVIVAALGIAGLVGGELYARHRANSVVAAATQCVTQDGATVSFGSSPFLLQHLTGHYKDITIHTAGNNIKNAKGMKADIEIDDVDLHGNADSKGTIGKLDANITWTSEGIQETVQNSLPFIGGLVSSVTTDASAGTIELTGAMGLGGVTVKPVVADGKLTLQVYKVNALGVLIPHETAQTALNTFTAALLRQYPLGIQADSVQVTNDGVAAHFSTHNASIPQGGQDPCFAHV